MSRTLLQPIEDLRLAAMLLTRVPVPSPATADRDALARAIWCYPIVGALVGMAGAAVLWAATAAGLALSPAIWLALAATILATGCFHEDGLADFWDGIGGGRTVERKLEIMRDSRIGSYGAAALVLSLALRASLLASMAGPWQAMAALIAAMALGRGVIGVVTLLIEPARTEGLAVTATSPSVWIAMLSLAVAIVLAGLVLPAGVAMAGLGAVIVSGVAMAELMRRQIGGYTGDGLGASEQAAEVSALIAIVALASA
ncbi:MAG: adenosylcobinamide-GDP ribazoletransferase [Hyphomicrobiales bacterium]|nr:adenosylcobinamide-GDP ribazoletransferase [Hyphomicrobiales bacterium]